MNENFMLKTLAFIFLNNVVDKIGTCIKEDIYTICLALSPPLSLEGAGVGLVKILKTI